MADAIDLLSSLFSPQEAEAAAAPGADPWMRSFRMLQEQSRQQATQQRMQLEQQRLSQQAQLQRERLEQQRKLKQPQNINELLTTALGTQPEAQPEVYLRDTAPGGIPWAGNVLPAWATPEMRASYEQQVARKPAAAKPAEGASAIDPQTLSRAAQLSGLLEKSGVPSDVRSTILARTFPGFKPEKELIPETVGKLWKFNPETRDFDPVPPEHTGKSGRELQALGYRTYSDKQRGVVDELKDVDVAFQQLRSAVKDISGKDAPSLWLSRVTGGNIGGPEGAVFNKATTNFTTIFDKFLGGVRGAASPQMQAIRAQVLPSIISTGKVSDRLMSDLEELITAMGDSRLKSVVGGEAFKAADLNKKAQKVIDTFQRESKAAPAQQASGGLPAGVTVRRKK